jgi:peptide/nickel transport system ATP-binding protein
MSTQQAKQVESESEHLLSVDSLDVEFEVTDGTIQALRDVSLVLDEGETLGIAGESGSGKSTLALAIARYLDNNARVPNGTVNFKGRNILDISKRELADIRGNQIAHVAQNASKALNPSMRVGAQIRESIEMHQDVDTDDEVTSLVHDALTQVNIPDPAEIVKRFPHELSGGQQQRVLIAMALACNPELLILDEPTTGLDVTTQAKLLDLIKELKSDAGVGILLITHNLGVIAQIADRVNILYAGEMMEKGPVDDVFTSPSNPYTQALLATTPEIDTNKELRPIPGGIPELGDIPEGCIFADRCAFATEECRTGEIDMEAVADDHETRCVNWETAVSTPIETEEAAERTSNPGDVILEGKDVVKHYDKGTFFQNLLQDHKPVQAVDGVDITIHEGETVGLVGESGCGKSTLGRLLLSLDKLTDGVIEYRGDDLSTLSKAKRKEFHAECQIIFQDPASSLNPRESVREIIERPIKLFTEQNKEARLDRVDELLNQVNLSLDLKTKQPHELSGGQQQRVAIARAFAANPSLVVLDEPVSSLDVSVQASILNLLDDLREEYNTSYLLISHDMGVIQAICDRLAVMYLGKMIEHGTMSDVFAPPLHPYTRSLLSSIPTLDPHETDNRIRLEGDVPSARDPPTGCSFYTRCPQKIGDICETDEPELVASNENGHCLACHLDESETMKPLDTPAHEL